MDEMGHGKTSDLVIHRNNDDCWTICLLYWRGLSMTTNFTAAKFLKIKHIIANGTVEDLVKEIQISWHVEPPLIDEIKSVESADGVFLTAIKGFFQSISLSQEEHFLTSKMFQMYLLNHPVRKKLLDLAYQRKMFENPFVAIAFNQTNIDAFKDAYKNGYGFMHVTDDSIKNMPNADIFNEVPNGHIQRSKGLKY